MPKSQQYGLCATLHVLQAMYRVFLKSFLHVRVWDVLRRACTCRLKDLSSIYTYQGEETCAADGMCQVKCPVKINTGELIKHIRHENLGTQTRAQKTAMVRPLPSFSSRP